MFNYELTLIDYEIVKDDIGNEIKQNHENIILCDIKSVGRYEFFNYGTAELKPEIIATVNAVEYNNQKDARFNNQNYVISRVYQTDRDLLELTLSKTIQR